MGVPGLDKQQLGELLVGLLHPALHPAGGHRVQLGCLLSSFKTFTIH